MEGNPIFRGKGIPIKLQENHKRVVLNGLSLDMVNDRELQFHLIHVRDPTEWEKAFVGIDVVLSMCAYVSVECGCLG